MKKGARYSPFFVRKLSGFLPKSFWGKQKI